MLTKPVRLTPAEEIEHADNAISVMRMASQLLPTCGSDVILEAKWVLLDAFEKIETELARLGLVTTPVPDRGNIGACVMKLVQAHYS